MSAPAKMMRIVLLAMTVAATSSLALGSPVCTSGDVRGPYDDILRDITKDHPARTTLDLMLSELPFPEANLVYRGVIHRATVGASVMAEQSRAAAVRRAWGVDVVLVAGRLPLEARLALQVHREALGECAAALNGSKKDPIHHMLLTRTALRLIATLPTRRDLEPLHADDASEIDATQEAARALIRDLLRTGLAIHEEILTEKAGSSRLEEIAKTVESHSASKKKDDDKEPGKDDSDGRREFAKEATPSPSPGLRIAARTYVTKGLALVDDSLCNLTKALGDNPKIRDYRDWIAAEPYAHAPRALELAMRDPGGREDPGGKGSATDMEPPKFPIADVLELVPWPYALAEALGLGQVSGSWEMLDPISAEGPEFPGQVRPRIRVDLRFQFSGKGEPPIAIESIVLRGRPVKLADIVGKDEIEVLIEQVKPHGASAVAAVQSSKIEELDAKFQAAPELKGFNYSKHKTARAAMLRGRLASNAGRNLLSFQVLERCWPGSQINLDLYALLWARAARDGRVILTTSKLMPPLSTSPAAPAAPASSLAPVPSSRPDPWTVWLKRLGVESEMEGPEEISSDVAVVVGRIYRKLTEALDSIKLHPEGDETVGALREAEQVLRTVDRDYRVLNDPLPGGLLRLFEIDWTRARAGFEDHFRRVIPPVLPAHSRFNHPRPLSARIPSLDPPEAAIACLIRVWNAAEDEADRAVSPKEVPAWREFLQTLAELEDASRDWFGEELLSELPAEHAAPRSSMVRGFLHLSRAHENSPRLGLDRRYPELENLTVNLEQIVHRHADVARELRIALLELSWISTVQNLLTSQTAWQDYFNLARRPPVPVGSPTDKSSVPALPTLEAAKLAPIVERRMILVEGLKTRLARSLAAEQSALEDARLLQMRANHEVARRFPSLAKDLPYHARIEALIAAHSWLLDQFQQATDALTALVTPAGPPASPVTMAQVLASWPGGPKPFAGLEVPGTTPEDEAWLSSAEPWISASRARLAKEPALQTRCNVLVTEFEAKFKDNERSTLLGGSILVGPDSALLRATNAAFVGILELSWQLELSGMSPPKSRRVALDVMRIGGFPADPADELLLDLHRRAAEKDVLLSPPESHLIGRGRGFWQAVDSARD